MKKIIIFILCIIVSLNVFSQILLDDDFNVFKSYFNKYHKENSKQLNEVPLKLSRKILGDKIIYNHVQSVGAWGDFECGVNEIFIVELGFPDGGYTSSYDIVLINKGKKVIRTESLGSNMLDAEGGDYCELFIINDSLLQIEKGRYNEEGVSIIKSREYLLINLSGYAFIDLGKPSNERIFTQSSLRILDREELLKMNKSNLDIIRNEIFADHGYIFKTNKWKDYFSDKSWYTPIYDNVNDRLTIIERINLNNILEITSHK